MRNWRFLRESVMVGGKQKLIKILGEDKNKLYPYEQKVIIYSFGTYPKTTGLTWQI